MVEEHHQIFIGAVTVGTLLCVRAICTASEWLCVCVCVSIQVPAHTQTDAMIKHVLNKTARLQDGADYGLFLVVTPTCTTVSW